MASLLSLMKLEADSINLHTIVNIVKDARLEGVDQEELSKSLKEMFERINERLDNSIGKTRIYEFGIFIDVTITILYTDSKTPS